MKYPTLAKVYYYDSDAKATIKEFVVFYANSYAEAAHIIEDWYGDTLEKMELEQFADGRLTFSLGAEDTLRAAFENLC